MVGDALSLKSRPVSASNGHWRGPFFAERRKGPLAAGHLPGNPPRTSGDRDPGGHIWGKSPQPAPVEGGSIFPDGRKRNICRFPDGNRLCANPVPRFGGELATNELYAHFEADGRPSDGAGSGMGTRRSGHGAGPPRLEPELRPAFRRNVADWGDATGVEGARRRRADRGAGPEVRICSIPSQKGTFSGPPIGTWSVSRQPAPIEGGTGGPEARSPWLEPRLAAGPLVRTPLGGRTPGSPMP